MSCHTKKWTVILKQLKYRIEDLYVGPREAFPGSLECSRPSEWTSKYCGSFVVFRLFTPSVKTLEQNKIKCYPTSGLAQIINQATTKMGTLV